MQNDTFKYFLVLAVAALIGICAYTADRLNAHWERTAQTAQTLKTTHKKEETNHLKNTHTWCKAINEGRKYDREHDTLTLSQFGTGIKVFEKAVKKDKSFTPQQRELFESALEGLINLADNNPKLLNLSPYTLPNLNCAEIENRTEKAVSLNGKN